MFLTHATYIKIMAHVKDILTHVIHTTRIKNQTTHHTDPLNPPCHSSHVISQPKTGFTD